MRAERLGNFGERQDPLPQGFGYFAHLSIYEYARRLVPSGVFVDLGCGSGYGAHHVARGGGLEVLGLERQPALVAELGELYPAVQFAVCDLNVDRAPLADRSADMVFCSNVLEHVAYPDNALAEAARVVAPTGRALIAVPPISTIGELRENAKNVFHITNLSQDAWRSKLERFFERVSPIRHWVKDENRLPRETKVLLGIGTAFEAESEHDLGEFSFEPVAPGTSGATLTAIFECSEVRARPLPVSHEIPMPETWRALQVEAEARQEAMLFIESELRTERLFWRREIDRLRLWILNAVQAGAKAEFVMEAALQQLAEYK